MSDVIDLSTEPVRLNGDAVRLAGRLAATLTRDQRVLLFTGTAAGHGVSTVSAEVARAFARMSQEPILLIDANIDAPVQHATFGVPPMPGLAEVLERRVSFDTAMSRGDIEGLWVLPRGRSDIDYVQLLGSDAFRKLLQVLRESFRLIVVDAAPLLLSPPTSLLASQADGVVAVLASGRDQRTEIVRLKHALQGLRVGLIGAVLTSIGVPDAVRPGDTR